MDVGIVAAVAMLIVWALGTFAFSAPGWIHLLLTLTVFILIWRIVVRGTTGSDTRNLSLLIARGGAVSARPTRA